MVHNFPDNLRAAWTCYFGLWGQMKNFPNIDILFVILYVINLNWLYSTSLLSIISGGLK
jgi:hypothetical protein